MAAPFFSAAPMEGLTGFVWREVHGRLFGNADAYYTPFITPTVEPRFTERQMRELAPEVNAGRRVIPQLLTRRAADFIWAAHALRDMGYGEVNLNLGCPAGTVVAKGKGSGFLRSPAELAEFLRTVFDAVHGIDISVKTRIGWSDEDEFELLSDLYAHFPIRRLIIHPRLKTDQYKGDARRHVLDRYYGVFPMPVGYNGDIVTVSDIQEAERRYPGVAEIMIGRALMADPALIRKAAGGSAATRDEVFHFSRALFEAYAGAFGSRKNALMRMKEYWFFLFCLFDETRPFEKSLYKARSEEDFMAVLDRVREQCPLRESARYGWRKALA
jgi:tRNA-dihydrouridine synthase